MVEWAAPQAIWDVSVLAAAGLAASRGEWEARTIAFGMVVVTGAVVALQSTHDFSDARVGGLILHIIYLAVLIWVALRSRRWWPLWTAAFQLVGVAIFLARMADPRIGALAWSIWSYLILAAVVVGVWLRTRSGPIQPSPSPSTGRSAT